MLSFETVSFVSNTSEKSYAERIGDQSLRSNHAQEVGCGPLDRRMS